MSRKLQPGDRRESGMKLELSALEFPTTARAGLGSLPRSVQVGIDREASRQDEAGLPLPPEVPRSAVPNRLTTGTEEKGYTASQPTTMSRGRVVPGIAGSSTTVFLSACLKGE